MLVGSPDGSRLRRLVAAERIILVIWRNISSLILLCYVSYSIFIYCLLANNLLQRFFRMRYKSFVILGIRWALCSYISVFSFE